MWQGIHGHDAAADYFRAALRRGRLASTYLFVGPAGIGKRKFAVELAKSLLCEHVGDDPLEPCGRCESCRLHDAGNHPDLDVVSRPPDKSTLPLELFIGDKDHRNQVGLCHRISLKPFLGRRKVAIIDDADDFSQESANCLLKTLEEPPPRSVLILIGTSPSKQLPTIRSRSQIVRFHPLPPDAVADILVSSGAAADRDQAVRLASYSGGSVERAVALADPALWQFREVMLNDLANGPNDPVRLARAVQVFVDEAGTAAPPRREWLRTIVSFAEEFYMGLLRAQSGGPVVGDMPLREAIKKCAKRSDATSTLRTLEQLESCLEAVECVDRNANLALAIQKWCDDLFGCRVRV